MPLGLVAVALSVPSSTPIANAVTKDVAISGFTFQSASVLVAQGDDRPLDKQRREHAQQPVEPGVLGLAEPGRGSDVLADGRVPQCRLLDVQKKAPGTDTWTALRTSTTSRAAFLNPTRNGIWRYRARTDNRSNGKSSGYSPVKTVTVS